MKIRKIKCSYYDKYGTGPYSAEVPSVEVSEEKVSLVIEKIRDMHPEWSSITVSGYEKGGRMTVSKFIEEFMHNNEVVIENRDNYEMHYRYLPEDEEKLVLMDWEVMYTDISDCEIICIKNVIRDKSIGQHITVKIDTEQKDFMFVPEKVKLDNAPLWLYNKMHRTNIHGCEACDS